MHSSKECTVFNGCIHDMTLSRNAQYIPGIGDDMLFMTGPVEKQASNVKHLYNESWNNIIIKLGIKVLHLYSYICITMCQIFIQDERKIARRHCYFSVYKSDCADRTKSPITRYKQQHPCLLDEKDNDA